MQYMGSKARVAKKLLEVMLPYRKPSQYWVEPFVGAGGMIQNVDNPRIGSDRDGCIVAFLNAIRDGWMPEPITGDDYKLIKDNKEFYTPEYLAFVGYGCSFGGRWFGTFSGGWRGGKAQRFNRCDGVINSIRKQAPKLKGAKFYHCKYDELDIPPNSFIYCDPPYQNTAEYKFEFNHVKFWQWCRNMSNAGHAVFISEYDAPDDFECVFSLEKKVTLSKDKISKRVEKLFRYNP
jgi:DNA adenine methylase